MFYNYYNKHYYNKVIYSYMLIKKLAKMNENIYILDYEQRQKLLESIGIDCFYLLVQKLLMECDVVSDKKNNLAFVFKDKE